MGFPCTHTFSTNGNEPLSIAHVNSFWWDSDNTAPSIAPVPVNDITAMLTALNNQFQKVVHIRNGPWTTGENPILSLTNHCSSYYTGHKRQAFGRPKSHKMRSKCIWSGISSSRWSCTENQWRYTSCHTIGSEHNAATCPIGNNM